MCIDLDSNRIVSPPCDALDRMPARDLASRDCPRYSQVIDSLSSRGVEGRIGDPVRPARDHFFAVSDKFRAISQISFPERMAAAREYAAGDRVLYLELITLPVAGRALLGASEKLRGDPTDFARLASALAPGVSAAVAQSRSELDRYEADAATMLGCESDSPRPACNVEVRYQACSRRTWPASKVFAALALGSALADVDPRWAAACEDSSTTPTPLAPIS